MKTTRPIFPQPAQAFKSDRLLMRPLSVNDVDAFHELRRQPEVMIHTSTGKIDDDPEATLKWINRFVDPNDGVTFCFAIEELSNPGKPIGTIGCHVAEPPEIGYMFRKEFWGKGYSTEALKAWLPQYWGLSRREVELVGGMPEYDMVKETESTESTLEVVTAQVEHRHHASIRILGKCGFKPTGRKEAVEDFRGPAVVVWFYLERPTIK